MNPIVEQDLQIFKKGSEETSTAKEGTKLKCYYNKWLVEISQIIPYQELTDEEVLTLTEKVGTFDFLNNPEEDIYKPSDGSPI